MNTIVLTNEEILAHLQAGMKVTSIASQFGGSRERIRKIRDAAGIAAGHGRPMVPIKSLSREEIVGLLKSGMSCSAIQATHGGRKNCIMRIRDEEGIAPNNRGRKKGSKNRDTVTDAQASAMLMEGVSVTEIGARYGGGLARIRKLRDELGIAPKASSTPAEERSSPQYYSEAKPKMPGWYWVQAPKMWPKVIPFAFGRDGSVGPMHEADRLVDWKWFCGPLPEPSLMESTMRATGEIPCFPT